MQIGIELTLALGLMGLGHYYVSTQRDQYPLDGYVFYALALGVFAHVWHITRADQDPIWSALRGAFRTGWTLLRDSLSLIWRGLRELLPMMSLRTRFAIVAVFNILAAILAIVLPQAISLWLIVWLGSIFVLIGPLLSRSITRAAPQRSETWIEPLKSIGRAPKLVGLLIAIGLLIAGQIVVSANDPASRSPAVSWIQDELKLGLRSPATALGGLGLLLIGLIVFAIVTRRSAVIDAPRLSVEVPTPAGKRVSNRWIAVAAIGYAIWLSMIRSIAEDASGWAGVLPWLISIGLIAVCWWKIDRSRGVRLAIRLDRSEVIGLAMAAVAILIVFVYRINDVPNSMWGDEGAFFSTARDIAQGKATLDFFGLGAYGTFPTPGSVFQSIFLSIFGANIIAWRLGSAVAAWLAIFPLYYLTRATLGKRVAWISIALYAISPYVLTYARMGYNNSQSIAPVAVTLMLTWFAIKRSSLFFAFLAGCVGGLGFMTYTAAELGIVLAVGWLIWMWIMRSGRRRTIALAIAAYLLGSAMIAAPPIVYQAARLPQMFAYKQVESIFANVIYARDLYPDDQLFASASVIKVGDQDLFYDPSIYSQLLARGVVRTALGFHISSVITENYLIGGLAEPFGAIYLLGLGWCLIRVRRPGYAIWSAWLIVGAITLSVIDTYPPRAAHMLPVVASIAVLSSLGLVAGIDTLAHVIGGIPDRIKSIILIGAVSVLAFFGLRTYFIEMPAHFPPDLENTMFWQAQSMPRGSDITLIQPEGLPDEFVPWGLRELDLGVNFHLIKPADIATADLKSLCPNVCRFYFLQADFYAASNRLTQIFGQKSKQPYPDVIGPNGFYEFNPNE
ncbi:MAG TPA: glycosyltransferase family 39 protein [Anaerolineae bacterium]|nr:glycosyltransferase family 39 protein [Anaerolineae bacterium]